MCPRDETLHPELRFTVRNDNAKVGCVHVMKLITSELRFKVRNDNAKIKSVHVIKPSTSAQIKINCPSITKYVLLYFFN